jgi:hypothetical protein
MVGPADGVTMTPEFSRPKLPELQLVRAVVGGVGRHVDELARQTAARIGEQAGRARKNRRPVSVRRITLFLSLN